jgi:YidC/Oxa1 family membrane protein insertase
MHDLIVRIASTVLFSGVLLFVAFLFFGVLYPRKAVAAAPAGTPRTVASRDYGYLAPVARPLDWTLRQIQARVTRRIGRSSWGWAIVVTTCLLNFLLLPFRILAAYNAKVMRALQPQLEAINARYKAKGTSSRLQMDPEHSREISELYRQHKTHPLSSCIPAIAPLLVLPAFYSMLTRIAELHGAHWLWVADLSQPEQLPIRLLPLLMIASQLLLGKITPNPSADPKMSRIMMLMPLIFGALFYGQPSALMLYWVTSNLLGVAQQYWLSRRYA